MKPLLDMCQSNRNNWQHLATLSIQQLEEKESIKGSAEEKDIDESETTSSSEKSQGAPPRKKWRQMPEKEREDDNNEEEEEEDGGWSGRGYGRCDPMLWEQLDIGEMD